MKTFAVALVMCCAIAAAGAQSGEKPADAAGTWTLEVTTGAGTGSPTFTFKQDGGKLTGRYKGQFGEADVTGTVKGNAVTFAVDIAAEGTTIRVTYSGSVEKDAMKGTVNFGDVAEGTFTGTRAAAK